MKKFSLFLTCLLATAGMVQAGLPLKSYTLQKTESVQLHEFSADATTIGYIKKGDTLGIASYDTLIFLGESALERKGYDADSKRFLPVTTGLREIGFNFPIEDQSFTKFGIGGNGYIYLGDTELSIGMVDKTRQGNIIGSNFFGAYLMSVKATEGGLNNVYDDDGKEYKVMPSVILVDDDTEIQYETKDNVLYIGFKNLHVLDKEGNDKLTATYQYWIEADGTISFLVGSLVPQEEKSYFLRTVFASPSSTQFIHFKNGTLDAWGNLPALVLSASNQYNNVKFSMVPPEICAAIEEYSIDWTGKITIAPDQLSFAYNFYDTEKATNLLMVLSTSDAALKSKLQDKTTYTNSSTIDGFSVRVAASGSVSAFSGLTPNTAYWLHVFPYNTNCADGPIYGMEIIQPVKTALASLDGIAITSINDDSINLAVSAGTSKYILGVSNTRMCDYIGRAVNGVLKDGISYQVGDTIKFRYLENSVSISADIRVLAVGADGATFKMENPKPGTEYFFYAWAMEENEGNARYSFGYVEDYGRTTTATPVVLDFVGKELTATPAGWETSTVKDNGMEYKNFVVTTYSANWDAPVFACENFYASASTGTVSAWAVSPWFKGSGNLQAVFNGTFYTLSYDALTGSSPVFSKSVNDADSVIFQIQEKGEEDWLTIGRVDSRTSWTAGFNDIVTEAFMPEGEFRFRMVFYQDASSSGRYFALKSLGVEQSSSCLYPVGIMAPEDSMGYRTAKLMWTDPNEGWSNSYVVKYREANDESGWYTERTEDPQIVLSGLKSGTDYVAEVNTVCSSQESSPAKAISFKTARNIVYEQKDFEAEELSDLGFSSLKGSFGSALSSLEDGDLGWFIIEDETAPQTPSVASLDRSLAQVTDRWLVSPVLFSGFDGKVKLTVGMSAWRNEASSGSDKDRKAATGIENDTLFIYRSANKAFTAESEIVGKVVLDNLTPQYQNLEFEFAVEATVPNVFGFYFRSIHDNGNEDNESSLGINLIKFEYTEADFPAITRLRTSSVTRTGFTARWEGEAESYAFLYKKRSEEKYDTVNTENTECVITGLEEGTTYSIRVFGYYGTGCTLPGPAVDDYVTTSSAPYCGTPTDLTSEYDSKTNSAVLSWKPGENNNSGANVCFRMADNQKYDTVTVSNTSHTLENMQTNTVYYWCVQGRCNSYVSEMSGEVEIKTEPVANAAQDFARDLAIRVNGRQIVVENAANRFIKALNVYSATGVLLKTYAAHTNGNILIQTDLNQGMVIIEAVGAGAERVAVKAVIM